MVVAAGVGTAVAKGAGGGVPSTPRPAWVNDDNTIDMAKMPAVLPVDGPDGRPAGAIAYRDILNIRDDSLTAKDPNHLKLYGFTNGQIAVVATLTCAHVIQDGRETITCR
jgi:hypothetical protein